MDIEEEIARALYEADGRYAWAWDELVAGWEWGQENGLDPNYPHLVKDFRDKATTAVMPLVKRAQAEAWADAIARVHARVGADGMLDQHALIRLTNPYIEQNSEGSET